MSFLTKVSMRNVFRYKQNFYDGNRYWRLYSPSCNGYGIKDTIADIADMQYGEVQLYDMSATLKGGVSGRGCGRLF